jgi:hypothetical protein
MRPFLHHMAAVVLMFEASTPFLKLRETLLSMDAAHGALFDYNNIAFSASFFAARILYGYPQGYYFALSSQAFIASGRAHSVAIIRVYQVLCSGLTILNALWMWRIVRGAIRNEGVSPRAPPVSAKKE